MNYTHLDKVFWPKERYTKGDVIAYYECMAPIILPYLKGRPLSLNRMPNGISGKSFYQKNVDPRGLPPFVRTRTLTAHSTGKQVHYIVCDNKATLLYLANLGTIEMNPWLSRVGHLDRPDYLIIDIDPGTRPFADVVRVARAVKALADTLGLPSFPKTSGKAGMHVYIPLGARYSYDYVRIFARQFVEAVHHTLPALTTLEHAMRKRHGKIYLDYLRNAFGQTCASPYSLRPVAGAQVSAPLAWSEVKKGLSPAAFTIRTIERRVRRRSDPWKGFSRSRADLKRALKRLAG